MWALLDYALAMYWATRPLSAWLPECGASAGLAKIGFCDQIHQQLKALHIGRGRLNNDMLYTG